MIFKINVFQWLCRTEHLTVFHMECACTHHCSSIMCVSWAQARGFLREDKPRLVASHLASPRLTSPRLASPCDPKASCLEKKMRKKGGDISKSISSLPVYPCARERTRMCGWLSPRFKFEDGQANLCIGRSSLHSHKVTKLAEEFTYTKQYFNTQRAI